MEEYEVNLLVSLYAIPWDAAGIPRVRAAHAAAARDVLLRAGENAKRRGPKGRRADSISQLKVYIEI